MNHDPHDPLEAALSAPPGPDDGGFTLRVLRALPPRRAPRRTPALPVLAGAAGASLAAAFTVPGLWEALADGVAAGGLPVAAVAAFLALLATGLVVAAEAAP